MTESKFKNGTNHNWADQNTQTTARAALAKHGVQIGDALASDDRSTLLAARNDLRRALNLLSDDAKQVNDSGGNADRAIDECEAVGAFINRVQRRLDLSDATSTAEGAPSNVLRGVDQIRNHYRQQGGDPVTTSDFFRGVARMKSTDSVRNALSVGTNTSGGFAVPSLVMGEILGALVPQSALLTAGAGVVALDQGAKSFTTACVDTVPTAAWRLENGALAESDPAFRGVVATPQSLAFYFRVSRELLADAPNMNQALLLAIAQAFAKELDRAGLRGTGTAPEIRGILNTSGIQTVTNGANGLTLGGYANFFSGVQSILQANAPMPTAAIMSPRSLVKLGGLLDTTNQPLNVPPMLQPMQMIATSQIPNNLTVGTSSDCSEIYVGDFTQTQFMFRENVSVQIADQMFAANGQIGFVCHVRADVAHWYPASYALITGVRA